MQNERLDSWKSISSYLDRGVRTVQRWHADYGMPVRRVNGSSSAVFAFKSELDYWLRSRSTPGVVSILERQDRQEMPISAREQAESIQYFEVAEALEKQLTEENLAEALHQYRRAINADVSNTEAFAGLAYLELEIGLACMLPVSMAQTRAVELLETALRLDSQNESVLIALALCDQICWRDSHAAREIYAALPLESLCERKALLGRALLSVADGDLHEAELFLREAIEITPFNIALSSLLIWVIYLKRHYRDVLTLAEVHRRNGESSALIAIVERMARLQIDPGLVTAPEPVAEFAEGPLGHLFRALTGYQYARQKQEEKAREILAELELAADLLHEKAYGIALIHVGLGNCDHAVFWLDQSYQMGSVWSFGFHLDPILQTMRGKESFEHLLARIRASQQPSSVMREPARSDGSLIKMGSRKDEERPKMVVHRSGMRGGMAAAPLQAGSGGRRGKVSPISTLLPDTYSR